MPKGSLLGQWTHVPVGTEAQKPYEMKISQNIEKKISTIKNSYLTKETLMKNTTNLSTWPMCLYYINKYIIIFYQWRQCFLYHL